MVRRFHIIQALLLHNIVATETAFSRLYETFYYTSYYRCYDVALRHTSKLACGAFCVSLDGCFGFSYQKLGSVCKICDYVNDLWATYDPSVTNVVEDFHLSLPIVNRCSYGKSSIVSANCQMQWRWVFYIHLSLPIIERCSDGESSVFSANRQEMQLR